MNCGGCEENCTGDVRCHQCGEPICPDVRGPGPGGEYFCSRECEEEWRAEMRAEEPDEEPLPAASCGGTTQKQENQKRKESNEKKTASDANVSLPRRASPAGDSISAAEPLAAIVREMRDLGKLDEKSTDQIPRSLMGLGLRTYADRIEAAVKRHEYELAECERCARANTATMRHALKRILDIEGYGAPWIEAKVIAQKALEDQQCTPPLAQERPKIEQPGNVTALRETLGILEKLDYAIPYVYQNRSPQNEIARLIRVAENKVRKALAAPQRNCDRFNSGDPTTDAANAYDEWQRYCDDPLIPPSCKLESAFKQWLFATMKENGGNKQ